MIETIGPTGHTGGMPTTLAATATFVPFAVLGGVITFAALAMLGAALIGSAGGVAYGFAAALALAAAVAEARGMPIVPQVRRQLPVGWRRALPMPLAAAGYGVLLGLGFTTFVLSYGVWALIGVCLALGDPTAGLVVGIGFGLGRALPIAALAPIADRPAGQRACDAMALRPGLLRGARAGDALALVAVAGALLAAAGSAGASPPAVTATRTVAANGSDPSAAGRLLAYEARPGRAILVQAGTRIQLPGTDPALGGPYVAVVHQGRVEVLEPGDDERARHRGLEGGRRARDQPQLACDPPAPAGRGSDRRCAAVAGRGPGPADRRDPRSRSRTAQPAGAQRQDARRRALAAVGEQHAAGEAGRRRHAAAQADLLPSRDVHGAVDVGFEDRLRGDHSPPPDGSDQAGRVGGAAGRCCGAARARRRSGPPRWPPAGSTSRSSPRAAAAS